MAPEPCFIFDGTAQAKEVDDTCRSISEVRTQCSWSQIQVVDRFNTADFHLLLCWRLLHHPHIW
jgi:hypothetical protein